MPSEDQVLRYGAGLAGVILTASAALSADLAVAHMLAQDAICGASSAPHCGWRLGAASLGLAGFAAFTFAFQPKAKGDIVLNVPVRARLILRNAAFPTQRPGCC